MAELKFEQRQAVMHEKGNILVSASAGSGKTFTMIERAKRLIIDCGVNVSEILAVTFTEMAAADMKEKLKKALSDKCADIEDTRLYEQLAEVSTSDICTLHAFCGRLIRSYFFEVGLSPDFNIMDESDASVMRNECVEKAFKEFYDSGEEWFYTFIDRHAVGRTDNKIKELVLSAYAFCDSEARPMEFMDGFLDKSYSKTAFDGALEFYKKLLDEQVLQLKELAEEALKVFKGEELNKAVGFTENLITDLQNLLDAKDVYAVKDYADYALKLDFERKLSEIALHYKSVASGCRDKLKKIGKRFSKNLSSYEEDFRRLTALKEHTQNFIKIIKRFAEIYAENKREENVLDFNDLEHFALKILENEEINKAVSDKYKYVFVDEYQDVNGVQEEIISKISKDNAFMVGDVKQSIYGFRGCKPEIFAEKFLRMQENGQTVVRLNYNFRSTKAVVNAVNQIFNFCMIEKFFGENYKESSQLQYGGGYPEDYAGRAELHLLLKESAEKTKEETPRIYDILEEIKNLGEKQPLKTASLLTKIINEELTKTYFDMKEGCFKQVTYGDIAVLTRTKNSTYVVDLVKNLARHGIPVQSDAKENVCDFYEIAVLVNALKAIDCYEQDIPLATALKSPIGAFSDEDLAKIIRFYLDENQNKRDGFYSAYRYYIDNAKTPLKERLVAFEEYFSSLRVLSDFIGAQGVLNKLIQDKNLESYFLAEVNGKTKVSRMHRFVSASVVNGRKLTVSELLERVETCAKSFGYAESSAEDTVKVMTIHASKGLEFPVVIVCGLERTMNSEEEHDEIMFSREDGFAVKYYDDEKREKSETFLRGIMREKMRKERMKEEMRLFYVATTRATNSLHLIFEAKEDFRTDEFNGAEHFIDYVPRHFPLTIHEPNSLQFEELRKGTRQVLIGQADNEIMAKMRENFDYKYSFLEDTKVPLKTSVTKNLKDQEQLERVVVLFDEPMPDKEKGTIAHKILECLDFNGIDDFFGQVKDMVDKNIISQKDINALNLTRIDNALHGGAFDKLSGYQLYREKPFLASVPVRMVIDNDSDEELVVQGIIDLLAIKGDKAQIVDYKYSSLTAQSLKIQYEKQLSLYAYAVKKALDLKVEKITIINLFTGETIDL